MRIGAIILAAGKGTRLKTELPKVLHEVCGRPMLAYVIDACRAAGVADCTVVVGYGKDKVMDMFAGDRELTWVEQREQLGTGHAVMVCREQLSGMDHTVVLCGDGPLIRGETIKGLVDTHLREKCAVTLATAVLDDPAGYGRICRDASGSFLGIVEHHDASAEQRSIREINPSYYCFESPKLLRALDRLQPDNAKREYYITDCVGLLRGAGEKVVAITSVPPEDIFSINSRADLALVSRVMRDRVVQRWMESGVTVVDPGSTWIDARATIGPDTVLYPNVYVHGPVQIGGRCRIGPFACVRGEARLRDGSIVSPFHEVRT